MRNRKNVVGYFLLMMFLVSIYSCSDDISQTPITITETIKPPLVASPTHNLSQVEIEKTPTLTRFVPETVIPTLTSNQAKTLLTTFFQNNGDCRFPCLWGVTPGKSQVEDLRNMLSQFGQINSPQDFYSEVTWHGYTGGVSFGFWEGEIEVIGEVGHVGLKEIDYLTLHAGGPRFETLENITPLVERLKYYLLPQVLSSYGEPSEVIIGPRPSDPDRLNSWVPITVGLFYPKQGFYIEYIMTKQKKDGHFLGCPNQITEFLLIVWNPLESRTLLDIAKLNPAFWGINENVFDAYYRSVEEALSITSKGFYENYKDSSNTQCFMAPISLWGYE